MFMGYGIMYLLELFMLDLNPEDNSKFVHFEVNLEEIAVLRDLLKAETIYQANVVLLDVNSDPAQKLLKIVNIFDSYREFDEGILDLKLAILEKKQSQKGLTAKIKNMIVINKNIAKIYKLFCTESTKLPLIDTVKERVEKYADSLAQKIEFGIEHAEDLGDTVEKASNPAPKKELKGDVKINVFGNKAKA